MAVSITIPTHDRNEWLLSDPRNTVVRINRPDARALWWNAMGFEEWIGGDQPAGTVYLIDVLNDENVAFVFTDSSTAMMFKMKFC